MDGNTLYRLNDSSKQGSQINKELNVLRKFYSDFDNKVTIREDAVAVLRTDRTILSIGLPYYEAIVISNWRNIESINYNKLKRLKNFNKKAAGY